MYTFERRGTLLEEEESMLLVSARDAIEHYLKTGERLVVNDNVTELLRKPGASFVALEDGIGQLWGCMGSLKAVQPLYKNVSQNAVEALNDERFPNITMAVMRRIRIEISVLTEPQDLAYSEPENLLEILKPSYGVIIRQNGYCGTYLPKVWSDYNNTEDFLSGLCEKAGLSGNAWLEEKVEEGPFNVQTFQVQAFKEKKDDSLRHLARYIRI